MYVHTYVFLSVDYSNVGDEMLVLQLKDEIDVLRTEKTELSLSADSWKKEFHELQSRYLPYQDQIDQLVSRMKGLQSQSDLAESEVCTGCVCVLSAGCDQGPLHSLQAVRMGQQFAHLVGHTNHRQKIQYVQKLTNENLSLKKVLCTSRFLLSHPLPFVCTYVCTYLDSIY